MFIVIHLYENKLLHLLAAVLLFALTIGYMRIILSCFG